MSNYLVVRDSDGFVENVIVWNGSDPYQTEGVTLLPASDHVGVWTGWSRVDGAFIPPQPFPSWVLNPDTALWDAPTPMPVEGGPWTWDEDTTSWVESAI